jgi:cbb3-type cytochrome oxidase subunit 3
MRLSDVMGHSGLSGYAEIALVLFLAAFLAIVVWTFRPGHKAEMDAMSRMPLEDDVPPANKAHLGGKGGDGGATPREARPAANPARGGTGR